MIKEVFQTKEQLDNTRQKSKYSQPPTEHTRSTSRPSAELKLGDFGAVV
jgi:hypothetical protein